MRTGVAVSVTAHVVLIALGLVQLSWTEPLQPTVESIAVDLVPVEEFSNIRRGQLDSEIVETETPSIAESDQRPNWRNRRAIRNRIRCSRRRPTFPRRNP